MAQRFFELLVGLAIFGLILRNPVNFGNLMQGLSGTYASFVRGLGPTGAFN